MLHPSQQPAPATPEPDAERTARRPRLRRALLTLSALLLLTLLALELTARFVFGLGDPPLFDRDPDIEYLYKPSRRYRSHHHDVFFNAFSMRSPDFPARKADPRELRILIVGDSIITGGPKIDQPDLATERLRESLAAALHRPVVVGNIAAGSWGPPNQLAYLRRFGLFEADLVILVLNSGDADDVPGLEPIGAAWPEHSPILALQEPARRLLERAAPSVAIRLGLLTPAGAPPFEERTRRVSAAIAGIADLARTAHIPLTALQFWKLSELRTGRPDPGHDLVLKDLTDAGIPAVQAGEGQPRFDPDPALFLPGDDVHPSPAGQRRLAEILQRITLDTGAPNMKSEKP